jgi:hypothetical protein
MVRLKIWSAFELAASITLAVNPAVPAAVGVPVITPVLEIDSPGGRVPESRVQE